ncbi:hypothetical protein AYL99_04223 [Fonsecaea erecta]|uniref:Xylanolytic transcriptional activator regulatory domain-containing protein n=1 Tax=Fonsecaea erecta TaxID=1367422 RepID=A0A178ZQD6_9EURO|nr:hypothetical protein AYL99_04223 [Fonsecaea erecta]OAP62020.1 hypothetical protein AYL99_04223 [Fonsecaea erecta]
MGLAVVESLVEQDWKVTIADKDRSAGEQVAKRLGDQVMFFETNVTSYEEQAQAFTATWKQWNSLDLVFANAGISDRTDIIEPAEEQDNGAPPKPDTLVMDVCLLGVVYTSYLALHFFRKNKSKDGSLVMTSSIAGIYAAPGVTVYGASKHGVIGLTKSLAYRLQKRGERITVNAICPALVATGLVNPDLVKRIPEKYITPTATIVKAVLGFVEDRGVTGEVAECSGQEIFYRPGMPFSNEGSKWLMTGGLKSLLAPGEEQACTEERPCPSCRVRDVECKSAEIDSDHAASAAKRPRLKPRPTTDLLVARQAPFTGSQQKKTPQPQNDDNEVLREEIRRLRRDVDLLSKANDENEPLRRRRASSAMNDIQRHSDYLYPLDGQATLHFEEDKLSVCSPCTDTFNPSNLWAGPDAIPNKISAILGTTLPDSLVSESILLNGGKKFSLTLPSPAHLRHQIDLYLREFNDWTPCFRPSKLKKRLAIALHSVSYSERRGTIHIPTQHCTAFAILCNILSQAETVTSSNSSLDSNTGQYWFLQGKQLMETFEDIVGDSVELVVYHVLAAGSMMEAERLRTAATHTLRALQAALSIGLNDKNRWDHDPDDIVSKRCLWWVLYFLEKRVHYRCGAPYLLRPADVNVEETLRMYGESEIDDGKLEYIEGMVSYTKLWTSIWSDFLAPNARFAGKWAEVQVADARVMIGYRELAPGLLWETDKVQEWIGNGTTESDMRHKLQAFLWHQSLRLIIRQTRVSSAQGDIERQRSCVSICKDIVGAIASYMKHFLCMRPIGYYLTCSLVDCVFALKREHIDQSPWLDQTGLQKVFVEIGRLLETLAMTVGSAQRALAALRCVLVIPSSNVDVEDDGAGLEGSDGIRTSFLEEPDRNNGALHDDPAVFVDRDRDFLDEYANPNIAETLNFLGLIPM